MNRWLIVPALFLAASLAIAVGMLTSVGDPFGARAATDIAQIAIDLNTTGNAVTPCAAYPCNSSTTLGAIDTCRSINVGDTITIDVVGKNIPNGGANGSNLPDAGASGSDGQLAWTPNGPTGPIQVTAKDFSVALIHQGPADNASTSTNPSLPDNTGVWNWSDTGRQPRPRWRGRPGHRRPDLDPGPQPRYSAAQPSAEHVGPDKLVRRPNQRVQLRESARRGPRPVGAAGPNNTTPPPPTTPRAPPPPPPPTAAPPVLVRPPPPPQKNKPQKQNPRPRRAPPPPARRTRRCF